MSGMLLMLIGVVLTLPFFCVFYGIRRFVIAFDDSSFMMRRAIRLRDSNLVREALESGEDPMMRYRHESSRQLWNQGITPLMHASLMDEPTIITLLVQHGAVPDQEIDGETALTYAVSRGNLKAIGVLLASGAYHGGMHGPLQYALKRSDADCVRLLLDAGIMINQPDEDGQTILMQALYSASNPCIVQLLLDYGADINAQDHSGMTGLMHVLGICSEYRCALVELLLGYGASCRMMTIEGKTVWDMVQELPCRSVGRLVQLAEKYREVSMYPKRG